MRKYDHYIFIKHFVYSIFYFQHIEMVEMEAADPESNVEVVATSSSVLSPESTASSSVLPPYATASLSVPPPEKVDKSTNTGLSVRN